MKDDDRVNALTVLLFKDIRPDEVAALKVAITCFKNVMSVESVEVDSISQRVGTDFPLTPQIVVPTQNI